MAKEMFNVDGNEATAYIAYRVNEVIAIYPITPSSTMGELSDEWAAHKQPNIWGTVPLVVEMQSEGGAAGAAHGALLSGALTTTFTASQGLLLMIPNMFKIAGELTSTVFHVSARSLAAQALSIFGDHSDVMSVRSAGWAMLASNSVQEAHDLALVAHAATLSSRVPFVHFFDGFRTSHEVNKIYRLSDDDIRTMIDDELVRAHRARGLSPENPFIRGVAQNADVYFQGRETSNPFYAACPDHVQQAMDKFATLTGRQYKLFDYEGTPDAERVIVIMGSGAETAAETAHFLNQQDEKVGVLKVRLYRPFSIKHFIAALPASVKVIAVLDRCKEPGAPGDPLYLDVVTAFAEGWRSNSGAGLPKIIAGRYGLSSKEFTPAMVKAVFDELAKPDPKNHFTVGIIDDVSYTHLDVEYGFSIESPETVRCLFWGLGADGTVGANKNSIKIIGEETDNHAQGYFVYDSKKSGSVTVSHLRFGPKPIRAPYLVSEANFIAVHQFNFLEPYDVLKPAAPGAVFLLNSAYKPDEIWERLPVDAQKIIIERKLRFYVIDAYEVAQKTGMGARINTIMQTCFFAISGVLPREQAIAEIKKSIKKTYGKRGEYVVQKNFEAVDQTLANLYEVKTPEAVAGSLMRRSPVAADAPAFVRDVLSRMMINEGDDLPVSALPADGVYPSGTTRYEKRNIAQEIPVWESDLCIQCGKCVFVCPHATIRHKVFEPSLLAGAPPTFKFMDAKFKEFPGTKYTVQVAPEDCTGCALCVEICPAKDKSHVGRKALNMSPQAGLREPEAANWDFFLALPDPDRTQFNKKTIKNSQLLEPLFEFSGACSGCGETPYLKLLTQLFGDRMMVANATGCSSIYGGNLPTTPWTKNKEGLGPSWANSLFEDNAEFGLGMRLTLDKRLEYASELLPKFADRLGEQLINDLLKNVNQGDEAGIREQRTRVAELKERLADMNDNHARDLASVADVFVRKSVWIVGGDGWAYDIGYGGLDHVLASGHNVKILVLDTEVYSNTGGQSSKSTPLAAVAKFAAQGKALPKKDLGLIAMAYGYVYVARIAMGAGDQQTLNALIEADAYNGPALVIAYSHCIAHGIDMRKGLEQQKLAVNSGLWPMYRYNPALIAENKNPLQIDSKEPSIGLEQYAYNEARYRMLLQSDRTRAETLLKSAQQDVKNRWDFYRQMAAMHYGSDGTEQNREQQ